MAFKRSVASGDIGGDISTVNLCFGLDLAGSPSIWGIWGCSELYYIHARQNTIMFCYERKVCL